jgi:hypothetical protein
MAENGSRMAYLRTEQAGSTGTAGGPALDLTGHERTQAPSTSDVASDHLHRWLPTRKWWAALFAGAFTIGAHAVGSHGWDGPEWAELLTLMAALSTAYGAANHDTPGGMPPKRQR